MVASAIEVSRPALADTVSDLGVQVRVKPEAKVPKQSGVIQADIVCRQQIDHLAQVVRQVLGVGSEQRDETFLDAAAIAAMHQFSETRSKTA